MIMVRMIMIITMMIMMIMIMMMMMMMRPMMTIMITLMNKMMAFMTPSARKAPIAHLRWRLAARGVARAARGVARLPLGAMLAPKSLPRLGGLRSDIQDLGRRGGEVKHNGCRDEERALSRSCYSPS